MNITINGKPQTIASDITVSQLLDHLDVANHKIAVEINRSIIPVAHHPQTLLTEGDQVEIIEAVGGG